MSTGKKPDVNCLMVVENMLEENTTEKEIFQELNRIVHDCWETEPIERP